MSELKVYRISGIELDSQFYLKSEADKVIAELEESHKKEVSQLLILNREQANSANRLRDSMEQVIRHHKYKRCLAMAKWCASRSASWCLDPADDELHKSDFYDKWKLRWLELAKKFKEE